MMHRVLVVDDHIYIRKGVVQILHEHEGGIISCDEASCGLEALAKAEKNQYSAILLDLTMPDLDGLDVLKRMKQNSPSLPVLMLTMHPEEQYAIRAMRAGASGYLTKDSPPGELLAAVKRVLNGGKYVTPSLSEKLVLELSRPSGEEQPHAQLSDREYRVMCMIAAGRGMGEIADELCLSIKTVSTYRSRILKKMSLKNNADIIKYALAHNLVA